MQTLRVKYRRGTDVPQIEVDERQIDQVLMNLVLNAAQASQDGDAISISTVRDGDRVKLLVRDDGGDISEEVAKRMFEPFFTTKAKGTGLGLPICRKIIEAHQGDIVIESQAGRGTVATIDLPIRQTR